MSEQDGRITRKEYYKIGLEEIRENNNLKNVTITEHNKVVNAISIGLLFTFLRFKDSFGEVEFPLKYWIYITYYDGIIQHGCFLSDPVGV